MFCLLCKKTVNEDVVPTLNHVLLRHHAELANLALNRFFTVEPVEVPSCPGCGAEMNERVGATWRCPSCGSTSGRS